MKNGKKITIFILSFIILLGIIFGMIDYNRIKNNKMPLFMIRITDAAKSKLNYIGLGYRMQRYVGVAPSEPLSSDNYVKFGLWIYTWDVSIKNENISQKKRYTEILDSLEKAVKWQIDSAFVIRDEYNCTHIDGIGILTPEYLISQGYLKQEEMLDVDGKSYCDARVYTSVGEYDGETCHMEYEIYLKCKDYETPGYLEHPDLSLSTSYK